jgi:hypothetical protein
MAKGKPKETPAADPDSRGEMKQFKIYLPDNDMNHLNRIAAKEGIKGTMKARMIIIEYLDNLKESDK